MILINKPVTALIVLIAMLSVSCRSAPSKDVLKAAEFKRKMEQLKDEVLIDVRTSEEYGNGHIAASKNIEWGSADFESNVSKLDKDKPIFVYCLAGKRSAAAAEKMRGMGFKQVYELDGGIMAWRAAHLPEENKLQDTGLSMSDYKKQLASDKIVLVDFSAPWCGPCKKMAPFIDELEKENAATLKVLRINTDDNQQLSIDLHIEGLPTVLIYKNGEVVWRHIGYATKDLMVNAINDIK